MNTAQIADELGVGCHAVRADWTMTAEGRSPEDSMFLAFGFENHPDFPYRLEMHDFPTEFRYDDRGQPGGVYGTYHTVIHAPAGDVETFVEYDESMARAGITDPVIKKHAIESLDDLEPVAQVFEHFDVVPTPEAYWSFHERIGERGLALARGSESASPVHAILHELMDMEKSFYAYMDEPDALRRFGERATPFYERVLEAACACGAEVIWWGANYDQGTTWPPFFEKEIVPWVARVGDRVRASGKFMAGHCDGENDKLMPYFPACRLDIAESVCTEPMTKLSLRELRSGMGDTTTVWGGLPAVAFMASSMDDDAFERHLDKVFSELGSGKRLILGVSDNVPVDADLDRLDRVTQLVREFGPVNPAPPGQL
jgi:hypothetical protein